MSDDKHRIVPRGGTTYVPMGASLDVVLSNLGKYDRCVESPEDGRASYFWRRLGIHVITDWETKHVNWLAYRNPTELYLGDVSVFDAPNLVVLFSSHDPLPLRDGSYAVFTQLGLYTEIPPSDFGYSHEECDDFIIAVVFFDQKRLTAYLSADPPLPHYDWKQWIKPNLRGVTE
jgi:hypothetical protein